MEKTTKKQNRFVTLAFLISIAYIVIIVLMDKFF